MSVEYDIEIHYALHGGKPVLIGAGSFDDLARIKQESTELDATYNPRENKGFSPGTSHFYRSLGEIAGVSDVTDVALEHYQALADASEVALKQKLRNGDKS